MIETKRKSGFTLIEIIIAIGIFIVICTLAITVFFGIVTLEKKTSLRYAVYDDAKLLMQQIAYEIQNNTVDYNEYFSHKVLQPKVLSNNFTDKETYGLYHGIYHSRFYNPGDSLVDNTPDNPKNLGYECSKPKDRQPGEKCIVVYTLSRDYDTGQNPYIGKTVLSTDLQVLPETSNAFCDPYIYQPNTDCSISKGIADELYLINETGNKKTIIGKQMIKDNSSTNKDNDYGIGMLKLYGMDGDLNGNIDVFTCSSEYGCPLMKDPEGYSTYKINRLIDLIKESSILVNIYTPMRINKENKNYNLNDANLDNQNNNFVLISPFRMSIQDVKFIINPIEDPYEAFAEPDMQAHPSVTILMTVKPSVVESERYPGEPPAPFTIQRTVTTGIHNVIETFPPTNELEWISDSVLNISEPTE
ncbi:MAG: prepilin-type N-terminal cleavage/methylation domain-containing protein [Candidatus Gracilibacteria bacterium]